MTSLQISLLGPFEVRRDDELVSLGSHRTEALFAYLVMSGRPQPREHLVDLLWREGQGATAPGNLRVLFTNLRKTVGDVVHISRSSAQFRPLSDSPCRVDVQVHQERSTDALARPADALRPDEVHDLRQALEVCRGDFLEHLELPEVTRFDEWVREQRDRLRRRRSTILQHLARAELAHDDIPHALRHARQLVDLEPLGEVGHQLVIRSLVEASDMDGAVAQFEHLERTLRRELGTAPSGFTRSLLVRRSGARRGRGAAPAGAVPTLDSPSTRPPTSPTAGPSERPPWSAFVDRQEALQTLQLGAMAACQGRGGAVVVHGSAGSGKTLLVRRTVRMLLEQDPELVALGGSCAMPLDGGVDDLLLGTLLSQLAGDADGPWLEAPIPPQVAGRIGSLGRSPTPLATGSEGVAAVAGMVRTVAHARPVVLIVDNLQWAAPATVALVASLAADIRRRSLYLVCTVRPGPGGGSVDEQRRGPATTDWLVARLRRATAAPLVELDVPPSAATTFVRALVDSEPHALDDRFVTELTRVGGGNALHSVELLRDLARRRVLLRRGSVWSLRGSAAWTVLPERIALLLDEVLADLNGRERSLLDVSAALGESFELSDLVAATGGDPWETQLIVRSQLCRRLRLLEVADDGFRFREPVLRQHLLASRDRARPNASSPSTTAVRIPRQ